MDTEVACFAQDLLDKGMSCLTEREQRVIARIARRRQAAQNINVEMAEQETFGERLADRVARLGGSWAFISVFSGFLVAWVVLNAVVLARLGSGFDPYPFVFLNLILSMVAALQAPVILMSQNRQAARDRLAASLDYEVNLKAEVEIMALHNKLDKIREEHLVGALGELSQKVTELSELVRMKLPE